MKAQQPVRRRVRRETAERERLIQEQAASGLTKKAFCVRRHINLATFYAWTKPSRAIMVRPPTFAQVEVVPQVDPAANASAAVEVLLPNGARVGIRQQGRRDELVALVRGVAGYAGGSPC
jgi:hypothetical protein